MNRTVQRTSQLLSHFKTQTRYTRGFSASANMSHLYGDDTPDSVKNSKVLRLRRMSRELRANIAKGLHLVTQSTPNGQKVQIMLEELADAYDSAVSWDTTKMYGSSTSILLVDAPSLLAHQQHHDQ